MKLRNFREKKMKRIQNNTKKTDRSSVSIGYLIIVICVDKPRKSTNLSTDSASDNGAPTAVI